MKNFNLETDTISFTKLSDKKKVELLEVRNHPEVRKWMYNSSIISLSDHYSFIESLKSCSFKQYFAVYSSNDLIGSFNLYFLDDNRASIGIYVNLELTQKGLGATVLANAIEYAKISGVKELLLEVFKENARAKAFYEKFGFKLTNQKRVNEIDVLCMSKLI
ncbi:UDP-4-amino-4,6-dideoxy-N-acetyl-beta-L-altrosamine N-acetyltransferase [Alteromonas mediterranea]|uniref:UDP-4-amino-4, 6-dideoxy-N-acetyl-beta-L-altrosamine N-acetyltransferase n=1 Tax=Alteromonas mediterranea TaxID=314275 RepID=UPI0009033243|nr:UDP-4-amino-4,6-dideoxy-N-acetyl-beta-L-altrosamine N-acetyltransferase [Alteromonas mediterranea]APD95384.1 UDP-4-amino-4,6-dideoxy-N-acetyl-beta-L-altrosamine N-acetyltransferase [Alteromonas mediterranea]APD99017.1 UDP-4-amino-4,6-dideoxy-N-acetyl-beta-L-altrosamine N-acetyltransferase [Alteromonas mediterranea]